MADIFNYEGVKSCMGTLDSKFSEFAEILKKANDYVNENIHVSHDSALYGDLGKKMLDSWNENASTFSDFYENFTSWSQLMASIMASYGNFENQTVQQALGTHQTTGAKMKGVQETRDAIKFNTDLADVKEKVGKGYTVLEEGVKEKVDLGNGQTRYTYIDGTSVTYITGSDGKVNRTIVEKTDGTIESNYKLEDGGSLVEKYDKNGKAVSSDIVDPNGKLICTREYTDKWENEKVTYYNEDGSVKKTVKVYDEFGTNMKDFKTSDMLVYSNAARENFSGQHLNITSGELNDIQGRAALDNNLGRYQNYHDYIFMPGVPTPWNPTGIPGMGRNHLHTYDDARFVNPDKLASGQEQNYVNQRVQERGEVSATEAIDIQSFKNEQGYSSVGGDNTPSGYNGGNSGYNPNGNNGGGYQPSPQVPTGNGGIQRVPYTGTNGGNPQPLPANGGQPQVVPLNNNGNSGYNPNNGNTTPQPSGPVYYV